MLSIEYLCQVLTVKSGVPLTGNRGVPAHGRKAYCRCAENQRVNVEVTTVACSYTDLFRCVEVLTHHGRLVLQDRQQERVANHVQVFIAQVESVVLRNVAEKIHHSENRHESSSISELAILWLRHRWWDLKGFQTYYCCVELPNLVRRLWIWNLKARLHMRFLMRFSCDFAYKTCPSLPHTGL